MRISYWSSDVCSSDLAAVARGLRHHPHVRQKRIRVRLSHADDLHRRARWNDGPALSGKRAGDAVGQERSRDLAPKPPGGGFRHRSEEHTSELQSLMRNSYAVFCLKKQTYTNHSATRTEKQDG